jgi:hypothetical protein
MRFLVRFYPLSWRNRYGVEFDALLEDATLTVPDTFDVFWGALKMQMTPWGFGRVTFACWECSSQPQSRSWYRCATSRKRP